MKLSKSLLLISLCLPILTSATINAFDKESDAANATSDYSSYYSDISDTSTGSTLGKELHNLMISTHNTYLTYGTLRNSYTKTDYVEGNASYIYCFWRRSTMSGTWDSGNTWNREHVWCQSLSNSLWSDTTNDTQGGGSDILHVRPASSDANSERSNSKYEELTTWSSQTLTGYFNGTFMPNDNVKGDVARTLMYVYMHYGTAFGGSTNSYTGSLSITNIVQADNESDAWDMLLKWNYEDPVDNYEMNINNGAYSLQGNRNPFIDNPDYAVKIWGRDSNYYTTSIGIVSPSTLTVGIDETSDASAVVRNGSGIVNYQVTSGNQYASVDSNGVVTGLATGYATITASVEIDGVTYIDTTTVKVTKSVSDTYELVTSNDPIKAGDEVIFVYNDSGTYLAMQAATLSSYYMNAVAVTINSDNTLNYNDSCGIWTVDTSTYNASNYSFYNSSFGGYLSGVKSGSKYYNLKCASDANTASASWSVSTTNAGVSTVKSGSSVYFKGDSSWPEFAGTSSSTNVYIYRKKVNSSSDAVSLRITGSLDAIPFGSNLLDLIGVMVTYSNSQTDLVTNSATYSSYDTKVLGEQNITVTFGAASTTFTINVTNVGADSTNFEALEQADAYNTYFLKKTYGDCSNATIWELLEKEYNAMDSSSKTSFISSFNDSGAYSDAHARYLIAINGHNMNDFMNQVSSSNHIYHLTDNNLVLVIIAIGLVGITGISIFFTKKKKYTK